MARRKRPPASLPIDAFEEDGAIAHPVLLVYPDGRRYVEVRVYGRAIVGGDRITWNTVVEIPVETSSTEPPTGA